MTEDDSRCPTCDCPGRHCACVLRESARLADRDAHRQLMEAAMFRALWAAAASCIDYNRDRLRAPRGPDEAKMIERAAVKCEHGGFWSGTTKGRNVEWEGPERRLTLFDEPK
jgi:hypothetical protein